MYESTYVSQYSLRLEKGIGSPGAGATDGWELLCVLGTELGSPAGVVRDLSSHTFSPAPTFIFSPW